MPDHETASRGRSIVVASGAVVGYFLTSQLGLLLRGVNPFTSLRTAYWVDQLSYMAIAANARQGVLYPYEPFTMTGISHYPAGYYTGLGLLARVSGVSTTTIWNTVGLLVQLLAVAVLALAASRLGRRWWLGFLAPLPFLAGTFSYAFSQTWFTIFQQRAVIWGPYGTLFSKNGEAAGLSTTIILVSLCLWVWRKGGSAKVRAVVTIATGAGIGAISSFQTYSFLLAVYLFAFGVATIAIATSPRPQVWAGLSLGLLVALFLVGPMVNQALGQLPTLVFGLVPALPGLALAARRTHWLVAAAFAAAAITAAPQILFTASGLIAKDPFLVYRVASNHNLGVAYPEVLIASASVALPLIGVGTLALWQGKRTIAAISIAALTVWVLLALNDIWGANAEPYRFWNNAFLMSAVVAMLCWVMLLAPSPGGSDLPHRASPRIAQRWVALAALLIFALSLPDWMVYSADELAQGSWSPRIQRDRAIASLARQTINRGGGLMLAGPCVDARVTKVTSGAATAWYNLGLAWPADKAAIDVLPNPRKVPNILSAASLRTAQVKWVITDSNCPFIGGSGVALLHQTAVLPYELPPSDAVHEIHPAVVAGQTLVGHVILWRVRT